MFMTILIPSYKANALSGNDDIIYPDVPTDKGSAYVIYKNNDNVVNLVVYPEKTFGVEGDTFKLFISASNIYFGSGTNSTNSSVHWYKLSSDNKTWEYQSLDMWGCAYNYADDFTSDELMEDITGLLKPLLNKIIISSNVNYSFNNVMVYDKDEIRKITITNSLVCEPETGREFYLVTFDLGEYYDSKYKIYYGYGNNERHKHSVEFDSETKKATIKHAFPDVAIHYELIANNDLNNAIIIGVYFLPPEANNKTILLTEKALFDKNGDKYIKTTLSFENFEKFKDIHPDIKYMVNSKLTTTLNYTWIIDKTNYDSFETKNIQIFLGDYAVINEMYYHPKLEGDTSISNFEDKFTAIIERELLEKIDMDNLDSAGGIANMVKTFIETIKDIILSFFGIIKGFFDKLNIWIRTYIISIFCVLVVSRIIKAVRK